MKAHSRGHGDANVEIPKDESVNEIENISSMENINYNYFDKIKDKIVYVENDNRPHISVEIFGRKMLGMVDTAALSVRFWEKIMRKFWINLI
jgi:hypothetical protein